MKISIIMPTFNDAESICESLDSVLMQSYPDWELYIVNDGSTDSTDEVVQNYINIHHESRIHYVMQDNADQLNAIKTALPYVSGDYIYILHSDDLLATATTLEEFVAYQERYSGFDAYTGDQIIIDAQGKVVRCDRVLPYRRKIDRAALTYLWLGRNLYIDFYFARTDIFRTKIKQTYLDWNMPYWLDFDVKEKCLNVKKMNFPMFRYRVFEGNYINSEVGTLNVLNGELRTLVHLMRLFEIPFYRLQYGLFRIANKLRLTNCFIPIYFQKEEKNKGQVVEFVIRKRLGLEYRNNAFLNAVVCFYQNYAQNQTLENIVIPKSTTIYKGSDMRAFNNALIKGELHPFYFDLFDKLSTGCHRFFCHEEQKDKFSQICEFLCVGPFIEIC